MVSRVGASTMERYENWSPNRGSGVADGAVDDASPLLLVGAYRAVDAVATFGPSSSTRAFLLLRVARDPVSFPCATDCTTLRSISKSRSSTASRNRKPGSSGSSVARQWQ